MNRLGLAALAVVLSFSFAAAVGARPIAFTGTLSIDLLFPFGSTVHYAGAGSGVANVTVVGGRPATVGVPASAFVANTSMAIGDVQLAPISAQALSLANDAGAFVRPPPPASFTTPGHLGGKMPLRGVARLCLLSASCASAPTVVSLPLSPIGTGGIRTGMTPGVFTLAGSAWTAGPAFIPDHGFVTGSTTSQGISLVTPIFISTANLPSELALVPGIGRLRLAFAEPIPEPHGLLLQGAVLAALAGGAWRRAKAAA